MPRSAAPLIAAPLIAALLGAPILIAPSASAQQSPCAVGAVAVVQTRTIFAGLTRYLEQDTALSVIVDGFKVDVSRWQGVIDSATRAYQEKSALLSPPARQVELRKLDDQNAQVRQRIEALQHRVVQERDRLMQPIENGVQAMIDSVRAQLRCTVVFDVSTATGVASTSKQLDITQRVIDRIRATGDTAVFGARVDPAAKRP